MRAALRRSCRARRFLGFEVFGSPVSLYRQLRVRQPVRYGAFLSLPAGEGPRHVLSCSPELFVEYRDGVLRTRPMKGTAPRSGDDSVDGLRTERLRNDPKNRAENLMIVDLLRNDIGRIARTGSVRVPALFSVESYRTVLQMTSSVEAEPASGAGFPDVLRALLPCGSITSAPKHADHASHPAARDAAARSLYRCDRMGRTRPRRANGRVLSVGADTYAAAAGGGVRQRRRHLARLSASARALGFRYCAETIEGQLDAVCAGLESDEPQRLCLLLRRDGQVELTAVPLDPLAAAPVKVLLAASPLPAVNGLMRHKTTWREPHDAALREAQAREARLTVQDLRRAERIVLTNALRGVVDAVLVRAG